MRNPRGPLSRVLKDAWKVVIAKHYNAGTTSPDINSEAALQAYFFSEIRRQVLFAEETGRIDGGIRVFVEPKFLFEDKEVIPDLVVCRGSDVIALIELKYLPRVVTGSLHDIPKGFKKDLTSLRKLFVSKDASAILSFTHERYSGKFTEVKESFYVSKSALFVWAGVYASSGDSNANWLRLDNVDGPTENFPFLQLHAVTRFEEYAAVESRFGYETVSESLTDEKQDSC